MHGPTVYATYPVALPTPTINQWQLELLPSHRSNPVESGPPLNVYISADQSTNESVTITLGPRDLQIFMAWWRDNLLYGTKVFNLVHRKGNLVGQDTSGPCSEKVYVQNLATQFTSGLSFAYDGPITHVSANITAIGFAGMWGIESQ